MKDDFIIKANLNISDVFILEMAVENGLIEDVQARDIEFMSDECVSSLVKELDGECGFVESYKETWRTAAEDTLNDNIEDIFGDKVIENIDVSIRGDASSVIQQLAADADVVEITKVARDSYELKLDNIDTYLIHTRKA
jgi:hypothetical protein